MECFFQRSLFKNSNAAAAFNEDAACSGVVNKSVTTVGLVGAFTQDTYEGLVVNNVVTYIPLTLTFHLFNWFSH